MDSQILWCNVNFLYYKSLFLNMKKKSIGIIDQDKKTPLKILYTVTTLVLVMYLAFSFGGTLTTSTDSLMIISSIYNVGIAMIIAITGFAWIIE